MALTLYHAEPVANSLKCLAALHEKGLPFTSRYVDLHRFEQHEPWFVALNPDGQVPVLDHDGVIITQTTVINEYLDDAFPDGAQLRPADALGKARVRAWNKFIDEHVMNHVSMHGWHRMVGVIARSMGFTRNFVGGVKAFKRGNITEFSSTLEEARREAVERMVDHAVAMGANAITGVRFDSSDISEGIVEIVAYGTAVTI
jgi:glutathione S-transferase